MLVLVVSAVEMTGLMIATIMIAVRSWRVVGLTTWNLTVEAHQCGVVTFLSLLQLQDWMSWMYGMGCAFGRAVVLKAPAVAAYFEDVGGRAGYLYGEKT